MDEEYDVRRRRRRSQRRAPLTALPGRRARYWPHRVYPLRSLVRRGQEGPSHGQE